MKAAYSKGDKSDSIIDMLLEKAELQGHITLEDLEEIIPRSGASAGRIEKVVSILTHKGVQVILPDETAGFSAEVVVVGDDEEVDQDIEDVVVAGVEKVSSDDTITLYLREMSRVPLLKMEGEVSLA
ncbi:MAG: hypothetical protein J7L66_06570, partial [Anaerolineaceae bacterium]|nr:hypothetical protein [Anaerolineaceae bacterium]